MKTKTVTKHVLELEASKLQERLTESFFDIFHDMKDEVNDLKRHLSALHECLERIEKNEWVQLFRDGWTMMMLDNESMEFVENIFGRQCMNPNLELEITVLNADGNKTIVKEDDINY